MKILIAEDDNATVALYKILFKNDDVKICPNGEKFISNYSRDYDVFIVDVQMPVKTGLDVLEFLYDVGSNTPVVVVSAFNANDIGNIIEEYGVLAINKPIQVDYFRKDIVSYINTYKGSLNAHLDSNLKRIEELTYTSDPTTNVVVYDVEEGYCEGVGLLNIPESSVQISTMGKGTKIQNHVHAETEYLIVIAGDFKLIMKNKEVMLREGGFIIIPPGEWHAISTNGCKLIAVTVPSSAAFPSVSVEGV